MRISAPGTSKGHPLRAGFTLVELLVVLTIVALMSAAVVLAMPDPRGSLRGEAERFAARVKAAQDQAVIGSRSLSVRVSGGGYGFDRREGAQWQPIPGRPFETQAWREGTRAMVAEGADLRLVFDPTGLSDPAELVLVREDERMVVAIGTDGKIDVRG